MEVANLIRYTELAVGLKPLAMECEARLRVTRTLSETPIGYRLSAIGYRLSFPNNYHFVLHLYHRFGIAPGVRYLTRKRQSVVC